MTLKLINVEHPECYFPEYLLEYDEDSYDVYINVPIFENLFDYCNYDDVQFLVYIKDNEYCLEIQWGNLEYE